MDLGNLGKYKGFKLLSLDLAGNNLLGSISYVFFETGDTQNEVYTTVLIGPNGSGKSNLLRVIVELFRELYVLQRTGERSYNVRGRFRLKYAIDDQVYEYTNFDQSHSPENLNLEDINVDSKRHSAYLLANGNRIEFGRSVLPIAIIANSIMITDKFLFTDRENFKIYHYQGIRDKPQGASTSSYVRRTVKRVVDSIDSSAFIRGLRLIQDEFSQSDHDFCVTYRTQVTSLFFSGSLTKDSLIDYYEKIDQKYSKEETRPPNKLTYYKNYIRGSDSLQSEIVKFCNSLKVTSRLNSIKKSSSKFIAYNLLSESELQELKNEHKLVEHLRNLNILYPPQIEFLKLIDDGLTLEGYSIEESSSGEFHLLSSMVGFMASISTHSLLLIDEPEVSLHPNWQMKYLSFLRKLLSDPNYLTCHIIVATHSHFLISDLPGPCSKIIGLKREHGKIAIVDLPRDINTFGWSAEEVLYTVFNVRSSRNSFLEYDLTKLVTLVNRNSQEFQEIRRIVNKISGLILSEGDPLQIIREKAEKYLQENNA